MYLAFYLDGSGWIIFDTLLEMLAVEEAESVICKVFQH